MSSLPTVIVSRRATERVAAGHPWIYRSDIVKDPGLSGGEMVRVTDQRGWFQGLAFWSSKSQISLRFLSREDRACDRGLFRERLLAARELRERLFPESDAWRLVHGEADLLPGLVVDRYGDYLVVQLLTQGTEVRKALWVDLLCELFQPKAIVERSDAKVRALEGLESRREVLYGTLPERVEYREGEVRLAVDLLGGQKTGSFLDQRENHLAAGVHARGRGLDCFSYVGGFALQLARHCSAVTAVEIGEGAAGQLSANAALNGLSNVNVVVQNAFDFLRAEAEGPNRYDTIVLDPPAFAKSKSAIDAGLRGYKEINLRAMHLMTHGGTLITSSCSFHIGEEPFAQILADAARDAGKNVQIVERRGPGRDHPVLLAARETSYLKCYVLKVFDR